MNANSGVTFLRLSALVLAFVILQLAVVTQFRLFGVVPDLVPVLVVCIGLLGGSTAGAISGFAAGFLIDMMLIQTMGVSSLILTVEGYFAGQLRELRDPVHPMTAPVVGALAAVTFSLGFSAMQFSLGQPAPLFLSLLWQTLLIAAYGALLANPMYRAARWAMMPSLGGRDDPLFRRRRASLASTRVLEPSRLGERRRRARLSLRKLVR
jgi:rod shape-determining protein MreD